MSLPMSRNQLVVLGFAAALLCESQASFPRGGGDGGLPPSSSSSTTEHHQRQETTPRLGAAAVSTWWIDHTSSVNDEGGNDESDDANEDDSSSEFEDTTWKQPARRGRDPRQSAELEQESSSSEEEEDSRFPMNSLNEDGGIEADEPPIGSQPLQTLEKLQQMLDETDYMTTTPSSSKSKPAASSPLWTSKDRAKYKKQQLRQRAAMKQKQQSQDGGGSTVPSLQRPPIITRTAAASTPPPYQQRQHQQRLFQSSTPSSDEEEDSDASTDDGLGYVLPDLPIYFSDDEGETSGDEKRPNLNSTQPRSALPGDQPMQQSKSNDALVAGNRNPAQNYQPFYPGHESAYPATTKEELFRLQQRRQAYYESQQQQQQQQQHPPLDSHQQQSFPQYPYPPTQQYYDKLPPPQQHYPPGAHPQNGYAGPQQSHQYRPPLYPYQPHQYVQPPPTQQQQQQQQPPQQQQQKSTHPQSSYTNPYAPPGWGYASPQDYARQQTLQDSSHLYPHESHRQQPSIPNQLPSGLGASSLPRQGASPYITGRPLYSALPRVAAGIETLHQKPTETPGELDAMTKETFEYAAGVSPVPLSTEEWTSVQVMTKSVLDNSLKFDSVRKIGVILVTVALFAYAAVSPRTLPLADYNLQFYENLRIAYLVILAPAFYMISVFDAKENDINAVITIFFQSFMFGYAAAFVVEIVATTLVRLIAFSCFEQEVFSLSPKIPMLILPWVLRENNYRPKRITLFSADFGASCVAAPIIEESVKLLLLQRTATLPRNFNWVTKLSSSKRGKKRKKRRVADPVVRSPGKTDCVNANQYVTHMLAASLGLKLADAGRRIFLYTKPTDENKGFYAVCRGVFPIHELCGTITALALAKRDLLGVDIPLWKLLGPAVVIHGMANFRGMKPIFKWNSATPWSEMQMWPWNFLDVTTFPELAKKVYGKLMWAIILTRVLGYCVKNYYMVNRKALKRTTKYAGNHAAFSAELATAEMLIKSKKK